MSIIDYYLYIGIPTGVLTAIIWWVLHRKDPTCGGHECVCFRITLTFFLVVFPPTFFFARLVCDNQEEHKGCPPKP